MEATNQTAKNYLVNKICTKTNTIIDQVICEYSEARNFMCEGHVIFGITKGLEVDEHGIIHAKSVTKPSYPLQ